MNLNGATSDASGLVASNGSLSSLIKTVQTWSKNDTYYLTFDRNDETQDTKGSINEGRYADFTATVASGMNFTWTKAQVVGIGAGTGNNSFRVDVIDAEGSTTIQAAGQLGSGTETAVDHTFASPKTYAAGKTITIRVYFGINNTGSNKDVGLRDVKIVGTYSVASTDPAPAVITTQPSNTEANVGVETTLTVAASGYPAPEYQWYSCDDAEKTNAAAIDGATSASYSFTPAATGTYYYYVTATNENTVTPVASNVVAVTVSVGTTADPTFTVYGNTVQLSCATDGAVIYYELGNADVKTSETKSTYSGAFIPASSGTIYAYAQKAGYNASAVVSKAVTLSTVGDVVGGLIATVQAAKNATTTAFDNITITSPASPTWDGRGAYVNHMKVSGTVTLTASNGATIKSIKIYGTSNDASKAATVTAGAGATVVSTPAELMPRDVTVGGVQTMTEIVITVDEPAANNSISFTLGRESRLYIEVYGIDNVAINPTYAKTTYVTTKALDFSGVAGLTAYVATAAANGSVTLAEVGAVPAGTPLMLIGTAGTEYTVPVAASASAPAVNIFVAGDGTTTFDAESTTSYDYILFTDGKFYRIETGTAVPVGKAYLHCTSDPTAAGAPSLSIDFGGTTGIDSVKASEAKANGEYYNLAGQRVAQPTKGLYIVNGRKVVIK